MLSAAALTVTSKMKNGHFYYAKWTLNSNCILTVISIMKQEKIAPGFSEISAQNHFYFATRQFLPETKSQKFQNRHINVQNGHIKMKLTVFHPVLPYRPSKHNLQTEPPVMHQCVSLSLPL